MADPKKPPPPKEKEKQDYEQPWDHPDQDPVPHPDLDDLRKAEE